MRRDGLGRHLGKGYLKTRPGMTYDPEVERAWERAAPVANIMLEGISLERKLEMARLRTPPVVSIDFSKWTRGILSQIDRILQSPDAFRDSIASNTEGVTRDRGQGGYPIRRGERLERTLMAIEDLGRVII